jgi:hypothetical protein
LLAAAAAADGIHRIDFRDPIAAFGAEAIERLAAWLREPRLAAFAVRTIVAAATFGAAAEARATLAAALPEVSGRTREDVEGALRQLAPARSGAGKSKVPLSGSSQQALAELRKLVDEWIAEGRPPQPAIPWPREAWLAEFGDHRAAINRLPAHLDRAAVVEVAQHASESPAAAEMALIACCAWGYGRVGYGTFRTGLSFGATEDAGRRLMAAAQELGRRGALAGYRRLGGGYRLFGLGPAFGTKYLFFCQNAGQRPRALIFDRNVADWLRSHAGLDLDSLPWSPGTYEVYLNRMHAWAGVIGVEPEIIELVIFRSTARPGSQWR